MSTKQIVTEYEWNQWYSLQIIETAEILDAYRARDFLLIDIEALLEEFGAVSRYQDETIYQVDVLHGAPLLHVIYLLESFISKLNVLGMRFAFFHFKEGPVFVSLEDSEPNIQIILEKPAVSEQDKFLELVMLEHLRRLNQSVHVFASGDDEKFAAFLKSLNPALVYSAKRCVARKLLCHVCEIPTAEGFFFKPNKIFARVICTRKTCTSIARQLLDLMQQETKQYFATSVAECNSDNVINSTKVSRVETILPVVQQIRKKNAAFALHCCAVLLTCFLQENISVSERAVLIVYCEELNAFLQTLYAELNQAFHSHVTKCKLICDLFDGRLFFVVCKYFHQFSKLGKRVEDLIEHCAAQHSCLQTYFAELLDGADFQLWESMVWGYEEPKFKNNNLQALHPINNSLLDEFFGNMSLRCMNLQQSKNLLQLTAQEQKIYEDLTHHHNHTPLEDDEPFVPRTKADIAYAKSVEASLKRYSDCISNNERVPPISQMRREEFPTVGLPNCKNQDAEFRFEYNRCINVTYSKTTDDRIIELQKNIEQNLIPCYQRMKDNITASIATSLIANALLELLIMLVEANKCSANIQEYEQILECFANIVWIAENNSGVTAMDDIIKLSETVPTFTKAIEVLASTRLALLVKDVALKLGVPINIGQSTDWFDIKMIEEAQLNIQPKYVQLLYPVQYNHAQIPRILLFRPDDWQLEIMNHVDHNFNIHLGRENNDMLFRSLVVSAPTSAGKSFITYYIVEQLLRSMKEKDLMVYVLPTNALCNQVYAEIESRFIKEYYRSGMKKLGLFTSNSKINVTDSQVLITNPQCLEILLLSHVKCKWSVEQLKYVILDEIHNIASTVGQQLEHILCLIQCPFIALSATIGNADAFLKWLQELALVKQNQRIVVVPELKNEIPRAQPLLFYTYIPDGKLASIHPWTLSEKNKLKEHIQRFHALSAPQLQVILSKYEILQVEDVSNKLKLFSWFGCINQKEVQLANQLVKNRLIQLVEEDQIDIVHQITTDLSAQYSTNEILETLDISIEESDSNNFNFIHIYNLVQTLKAKHMLPAIAFLYSKDKIEECICVVIAHLMATNSTLFSGEVTRAKVLLEKNSIAKDFNVNISTPPKLEIKIIYSKNNDEETIYVDSNLISSKYNELKQDGYEIRYMSLCRQNMDSIYFSLLGFEYGIAAHHNSMDDVMAREVERLFRLRLIPLVFATGTLAFGLNMPCKTVCIIGVSQYLTNDMFIQCIGRAGRRNLDIKGNAVLFGMRSQLVKRYLTCNYPNMFAYQSVSPSFIIRLLTWYTNSMSSTKILEGEKLMIKKTCLRTLNNLIASKTPESTLLLKQSVRFILDFLRREKYIDENGQPIRFAGLIHRTFYCEPNNFVYVHLLQQGTLTDVLNASRPALNYYENNLKQFLIILVYLFTENASRLFCDTKPVPLRAVTEIGKYNQLVYSCFANYFTSFAQDTAMMEQLNDQFLPLSKFSFEHGNINDSSLLQFIKQKHIPNVITSSFFGLSGVQDVLDNPLALVHSIKHTFSFDMNSIPFKYLKSNNVISAFLVDFYEIARKFVVDNDCQEGQDLEDQISKEIAQLAKNYCFLSPYALKRSIKDFLKELKKLFVFAEQQTNVNQAAIFDITEDIVTHSIREIYEICKACLDYKQLSYTKKLHFALWRLNYEIKNDRVQSHIKPIQSCDTYTKLYTAIAIFGDFWRETKTVIGQAFSNDLFSFFKSELVSILRPLLELINKKGDVQEARELARKFCASMNVLIAKLKTHNPSLAYRANFVKRQFYAGMKSYYTSQVEIVLANIRRPSVLVSQALHVVDTLLKSGKQMEEAEEEEFTEEYYQDLEQKAEFLDRDDTLYDDSFM